MSNAKVIAIVDHEVKRSRDRIQETLAALERALANEVTSINLRMRAVEQDVERLKQGGGSPQSSA